MPEFVSMVQYQDFVLAITREGELWKIWVSSSTGQLAFQNMGRLGR